MAAIRHKGTSETLNSCLTQSSSFEVVLRDLAKIHSSFLTKQQWLTSQYWLDVESAERMMRMQPLWAALLHHAEITFPEMWTKDK